MSAASGRAPFSSSSRRTYLRGLLRSAGRIGLSLVALGALGAYGRDAYAQAPQYHAPVVAPNSTLTGVDYNSRYEVYGGVAYSHFDAGPSLLQGANLGGFDIQGARYFTHKWSADANVRGYFGTSGVTPNDFGVRGPAVTSYMFMAGPQYRLVANEHGSISLHALFGGTYGQFDSDLGKDNLGNPVTPGEVGLFDNQLAFGSAIGGSIDLNRSPRLAFRISPDAVLTDYSSTGKGDFKEQFGLSVGLVYRLGRHIDADRKGAPARPVR
ncbi:hypothetical protein D1Y84_09530 [Acidipila sp. EB88]|nr:hypothetical protein D1Y84_09530 [Acidipila sp. EB88]